MTSRKDSKNRALKEGESQRSDGRYQWTYKDNWGKKHYIYDKDLNKLRAKAREVRKDLEDGIDFSNGTITLNELFKTQMKFKDKLKDSTKANYYGLWKKNVEPSELGKMQIKNIRQPHIQQFYKECKNRGLRKRTIGTINSLIYSSLEYAAFNDYIRKNYAKGCMANLEDDAKEKTPLTAEEKESLIEFCANSNQYSYHVPFLEIAMGTGLRVGELTGLQWKDVDLKARTITVDHQLIYKNLGEGCKFYIKTPKTKTSTRTVSMFDSVYEAFLELRKMNMILGRFCNTEIDGYNDFVFVSCHGEPLAPNAVNSFLSNIEKAYNKANPEKPIPHLSAHILRHTFCTMYSTEGMDVKALQGMMGHKSIEVTENVYDHTSYKRTEAEVKRINEKLKVDKKAGNF
jgi:integrase